MLFAVFLLCTSTVWSLEDECGVVTVERSQALITGGNSAIHGEVPWHAGIYTKTTIPYKQICGGSLISNNIVISAAYCFWDEETLQLSAENFAVAVGKLYSDWNTNSTHDMHQQHSDVKEVHLPVRYQGNEANNQEDIALIIVTNPFHYTTFVRPVCVDFDIHLELKQLSSGNIGKIAGWGLTADNGSSSQVLKVTSLPYVGIKTCIAESPHSFRSYITGDKFCAGYKQSNQTVCTSDKGSGLVFEDLNDPKKRHYLRGVLSSTPSKSNCNTDFYSSFTQLLKHEHFIKLFFESQKQKPMVVNLCDPVPSSLTSTKTGQKAWDKCLEYQEQLVFPCVRKAPFGDYGRVDRCHHYSDLLYDGKTNAELHEFSHMAHLVYGDDLQNGTGFCGGSLISDTFVLTAAHCAQTVNLHSVTHVVLGLRKLSDVIQDRNLFKVKQVHNHPEYKRPQKYHDIALLELEKKAYLDEFLVPACLHTGELIEDSLASATGWGTIEYHGGRSDDLKKMILAKNNTIDCVRKFPPFRHMRNGFDPNTQTCYQNIPTSLDTCQGDSGGPLQVKNSKIACMHTIIGVTSFGRGCNIKDEPGLYTKVSHYIDWIESIVWP